MSALVSIIVPVYNLEGYVENCIRSLMKQTYENIEILCIDDGSTDNSATVIKKLAEGDQRVKYIYKENGGVSSARNKGLEVANGEYIMFVDGDDYMHFQAVEILIKEIVKGSYDLLSSNFDLVDSLTLEASNVCNYNLSEICIDEFFKLHTATAITSACGKIFPRSTVGSFKYPDNITNGEDTIFLFKVLSNCKKIGLIDYPLYYYYRRVGSASRSGFKFSLVTMIEGFSDLCVYLNNNNSDYLLTQALNLLYKTIFSVRTLSIGTNLQKTISYKCKVIGKKNIKLLIENENLGFKEKILFIVFLYSRHLYELVRMIQDPTMKDFYKNRKKNRKV